MAKARRKKKRRRRGGAKKRGGVMIGMRGGIKSFAGKVTGSDKAEKEKSKKASIGSTLFTVVIVLVAAALLYRRFR